MPDNSADDPRFGDLVFVTASGGSNGGTYFKNTRTGGFLWMPHNGPAALELVDAGPEDLTEPGREMDFAELRQFAGDPQGEAGPMTVADFSDDPDTPGTVTQDPDGRRHFLPMYGPVSGQKIELGPGTDIVEVMDFAKGPPSRVAQREMPMPLTDNMGGPMAPPMNVDTGAPPVVPEEAGDSPAMLAALAGVQNG